MAQNESTGNGSFFKVDPDDPTGGSAPVQITNQLDGTLSIVVDAPESTNKSSSQEKSFLIGNVGWSGSFGGQLDNDPALDLNGTDEYCHVADAAGLDLTTAVTIQAIFIPDVVTGTQIILHKHDGTDGYILRLEGNEIELVIDNSGTTDATATTDAADLVAGRQYKVKAIYDGAGNTIKIYVDRSLEANTVAGTVPNACGTNATRMTVGTDDSASGDFFDGKLFNVGLDNIATDSVERMTAADAVALYLFNGDATDAATAGSFDLTEVNITAADYGDRTLFTMKNAILNKSKLAIEFDESGTGLTLSGTIIETEITRNYPQNEAQNYSISFVGDSKLTPA